MKEYLIDVPVMLTFFVRPATLERVFEVVKEVRPSKLFLVSDGPRDGYKEDKQLNNECKRIVSNIDWNCEVRTKYSETNIGIDNNTYLGLQWAFNFVDRLIFLEDDIVASKSFFRFSKELLEMYKDDQRVHVICGMNQLGEYHNPRTDYFFSRQGSIWGFALWKRTFESFENLDYVKDDYAMKCISQVCPKQYKKRFTKFAESVAENSTNKERIHSYELINGSNMYLNNRLCIVSSRNQICNIGISANSGHAPKNLLELPRKIRGLFFMKTHEIDFPIHHPKYVIADYLYEKAVIKILRPGVITRYFRNVSRIIRRIFFFLKNRLIKKRVLL